MQQSEASELVSLILAYYRRDQMPAETQALYERALMPFDPRIAYYAIDELCQGSKWLPSVAELREAISARHQRERLRVESEQRALMARSAAPKGYGTRAREGIEAVMAGKVSGAEVIAQLHREFGCESECGGRCVDAAYHARKARE